MPTHQTHYRLTDAALNTRNTLINSGNDNNDDNDDNNNNNMLCHLVAGGLCVDELVEDPLPELRPAPEHGGRGQRGAEEGNIRPVIL